MRPCRFRSEDDAVGPVGPVAVASVAPAQEEWLMAKVAAASEVGAPR
jgi:hypothetical protein